MVKGLRALMAGVICLGIPGGMLAAYAYPLWSGQEIRLGAARAGKTEQAKRDDHVTLWYGISRLRLEEGEAIAEGAGAATQELLGAAKVKVVGEWLPAARTRYAAEPRDGYGGRSPLAVGLRDRVLYVQLEPRGGEGEGVGLYEAVSISDRPVEGKVNLRGRVRQVQDEYWNSGLKRYDSGPVILRMEYGVEALYVGSGRGGEIDRQIREAGAVQAVVAVAPGGRARLKEVVMDGRAVGR